MVEAVRFGFCVAVLGVLMLAVAVIGTPTEVVGSVSTAQAGSSPIASGGGLAVAETPIVDRIAVTPVGLGNADGGWSLGEGWHPSGASMALQSDLERSYSALFRSSNGSLATLQVQAGSISFEKPAVQIGDVEGWTVHDPDVAGDLFIVVSSSETFATLRLIGIDDDNTALSQAAELWGHGPGLATRTSDRGILTGHQIPPRFGDYEMVGEPFRGLPMELSSSSYTDTSGRTVDVVTYPSEEIDRGYFHLALEGGAVNSDGIMVVDPSVFKRAAVGFEPSDGSGYIVMSSDALTVDELLLLTGF